jgi:transcriptional regulator with XRE-family HTH domain
MTNLNNTEHMRQLIQLVESHILDRLAETWSQDQLAKIKQQIIDYRKEGWTDREISERMGKEPKWVATMVYNHFPDLRKQTKLALAAKDDDKEKISQEFQQGNITIKQLAKKNGIDGKTVKHWLEDKLGKEEVARLQALYTSPDRNWTQEEKDWVEDQYRSGIGPTAIAAIFMKNIDRLPPGTEEMTDRHVNSMLKGLPNFRELQSQFQANRNLRRKPKPFTRKISRPGQPGDAPGGQLNPAVGRVYPRR